MKLSDWRKGFLRWLQNKTSASAVVPSADGWYLEAPDMPGMTQAFLPPLTDVNYTTDDTGVLVGSGTQQFYMVFRYPNGLYQQLAIDQLEGIHSTLSIWIATEWGDIADLIDLRLVRVDQPVSVNEATDSTEDWVIQLSWLFQLSWVAEAEEVIIPIDFKKLRVALFRWDLDGDREHKHLDYIFYKTKPE
ncbi:hypothetical protein [Floridanema aerugineum]|uniref:Uncharacterized protein n=1 Tax=Floridaenema aerugineum BLCC-F46 TaxID=3153654 RepID=A0ABV4X244_9CYAN